MATVGFALLCNSALEHGGLVSILGGGLDFVSGPQLPIQTVLNLVIKVVWDEEDLGRPHVLRIVVEHAEDGEQLARAEGGAEPLRGPKAAPDLPVGNILIQPLPLDIGRAGRYRVAVSVDGETLVELPLTAETTLPQL